MYQTMDSIIFDLDGTIWDSVDTIVDAWNSSIQKCLAGKMQLTRADLEGVMGLQADDISKKLFPTLDEELRKKVMDECFNADGEYIKKQGGQLYPNVKEVLSRLSKKYKLFIVSNCQEGYIEAFYEYHQLEKYFLDFENAGRTGLSKGENIKLLMERNNLQSSVYVGDTAGDLKAARFAGIPFVYAEYGFGTVIEYDYVIERFDKLLEIF